MADNVTFQDVNLATPPDATVVATDEVAGSHHQKVKVEFGVDGTATQVSGADPLPVTGAVTTDGLTDGELRATPVDVSGPLTDAQLRTTPVDVTGPLTDTELRALAVPVSMASAPLPTGGATEAKQDDEITKLAGGLPAALGAGGGVKVDGSGTALPVSAASLPLPAGASTSALQGAGLPVALGAGGGVKVDGSGTALPVSASALPLPTGAATLAEQQSQTTKLAGGLPSALAAGGGVKVEGVAGGVVVPISAASLPLPAGAATSALQTQPGVDIGDVTVNNGAAGAAVNIQDGGNSITVDSSIKNSYGTEAQAITCTLTSLASSATAGREGLVVSNLTDLFSDVFVFARVKLDTGTIGNDKRVYVWAYGTVDVATPLYPDTITGADAAITFNSPINLQLLGIIECPAQSTSYKAGPWSLAQLFGTIPEKWGIAIQNYTNIALTAVAGDHKVLYQGVNGKLV